VEDERATGRDQRRLARKAWRERMREQRNWSGRWDPAAWDQPTPDATPRRRGRHGLFGPVFLGFLQVFGTNVVAHHPAPGATDLAYALLLLGPAALLLRRGQPRAVFMLLAYVITLVATGLYLAADLPRGPFFLASLAALFSAARYTPFRRLWSVTALAYAGFVIVTVVCGSLFGVPVIQPSIGAYVVYAIVAMVAVMLAEANRIRSEQFRQAAQAAAEARRARQEQSRRQASDERLRIARELHDVLGHHLSLINVRAGVALHLLDSRPDEVRRALDAIKLASAEALREVRGVLATLNPTDERAPRTPTHGLSDVDRLAEEARDAGLPVTVLRDGDTRPVPAEVDRAAYRIVQEALTNVRRHAGTLASATVRIGYRPGSLALSVEDTGVGPATPDESGNGIPGMRERAAALGGSLTVGAGPEGGFRVVATLPTGPDAGIRVDEEVA
jgi:signal transduction histidine kinase